MALSETEEVELLTLLEQEHAETVSPKIETARDFPGMIIGSRGGRGAGAKSTGFVSLLVQESHRYPHRVACLREVQNSLEESVYELVQESVDRLRYPGWKFTREYIESPAGAHWIFRGLKDMRSEGNIRGLQGFTRFFVDEAAYISGTSIDVLLPTLFRNPGSQFWFCYNPLTDFDPVTEKIWTPYAGDPNARLIDCEPGAADNPWWSDELQKLSDKMHHDDPDLWEHIYGGKPMKQGERSVMARTDIREAMNRDITPEGVEQIGIDVARFGDDHTVMYKRHGLKVTEKREFVGQDTQRTAKEAWDMAGHDAAVLIVVDDDGVGGGVTDRLREFNARVMAFHSNATSSQPNRYKNAITELWFEFPVGQADLPDDPELMRQLSGRQYDYERGTERKFVEPKSIYKKRLGRSPDDADALLLCYYSGAGRILDTKHREAMKRRKS